MYQAMCMGICVYDKAGVATYILHREIRCLVIDVTLVLFSSRAYALSILMPSEIFIRYLEPGEKVS